MQADPSMTAEFKTHFYPRFDRRWRIAEVIGRSGMACVVTATLFGLLGGGPVNLWTHTVSFNGLSVTYQPVAAETQVQGV